MMYLLHLYTVFQSIHCFSHTEVQVKYNTYHTGGGLLTALYPLNCRRYTAKSHSLLSRSQ
jgi:hypothetical protein